jgi:membrane-associated phospholipid phosphatase
MVFLALGLLGLSGPVWAQEGPEPRPPVRWVQEESFTEGVKAVVEDVRALAVAPLHMDRYDALKLGGAAAVVGGLVAADHGIQHWVDKNNNSSTGRNVADGFSTFGSATTLLGVNAGVIALGVAKESYGGGGWIKEAGLVSLEAEVFSVAAVAALKELLGRSRPESNQGATNFRPFSGLNSSMPSTHAAASFAVAAVFADRFDPAIGWLSYGLATAVAASRVYTDKHFTSDVVLGGLIGWGLGKFLSRRHGGDPTDWQVRPITMPSGQGVGLAIGKQF